MEENKDSQERRNQFIETAEQLFRRNGIMNTTVNSIVKELNVAKGLFYYYFTSKDDIIDAICGRYTQNFHTRVNEAMEMDTYEHRLYHFLMLVSDTLRDMWQNLQGGSGNIDLSILVSRTMEDVRKTSVDLLEKLLEEGNEQEKIEVTQVHLRALALIGGLSELVQHEEITTEETEQYIRDLIYQMRKDNTK